MTIAANYELYKLNLYPVDPKILLPDGDGALHFGKLSSLIAENLSLLRKLETSIIVSVAHVFASTKSLLWSLNVASSG